MLLAVQKVEGLNIYECHKGARGIPTQVRTTTPTFRAQSDQAQCDQGVTAKIGRDRRFFVDRRYGSFSLDAETLRLEFGPGLLRAFTHRMLRPGTFVSEA